jgi:Pectate lyase superfamily protein
VPLEDRQTIAEPTTPRRRRTACQARLAGLVALAVVAAIGLTSVSTSAPAQTADDAGAALHQAPSPEEPPKSASVSPYGLTPGASQSSSYSVSVDGGAGPADVPVEAFPGNFAHARWAMNGPVTVRVTASREIAAYRLSPAAARLAEAVSGRQITFRLDRPRKLLLHGVSGIAERLVLVAEPPETGAPDVARADVRNAVTDGGVDATGADDAEARIQSMLAAPGTSAVVLPRGRYRLAASRPLAVPAGKRLHLAPEALLFADPGVPNRTGGSLIQANAGSQITGRGIIDGSGTAIRPEETLDWVMVRTPAGAAGLTLRDVTIRNSPRGALSVQMAPGFAITNVKVVNGLDSIGLANGDGIHPQNGSNGGLIDDSLILGSDDPLGLGYRSGTESVTMSNLLLGNLLSGAALKAVFHADHPDAGLNRNMALENVDVIGAPRIISYIPQHPGVFSDHYFKNVRAEGYAGEGGGAAVQLDLSIWDEASTGAARIDRFFFSGIELPGGSGSRSTIQGADAEHRVTNVVLEDFRIGGAPALSATDGRLTLNEHTENVVFSGVQRPQLAVDPVRPLVGHGEATAFRIARTGAVAAPLRVRYRLEGAVSGDREVTIPAGSAHVDVPVTLAQGGTHALLILQSSGPNLDYLIGPRYLAMVGVEGDGVIRIASARFQARWARSRVRGALVVALSAPRAAEMTVDLLPGSSARPLRRWRARVPRAGQFTRRLPLKATTLPGRYRIRVRERVVPAARALAPAARGVRLRPPPEGVVSRAFISRRIGGKRLGRIAGSPPRVLFANFRIAAQPKRRSLLRVEWYRSGRRRPVATKRVLRVKGLDVSPLSSARRGPPSGGYRAVLRYRRTVVAVASATLRGPRDRTHGSALPEK